MSNGRSLKNRSLIRSVKQVVRHTDNTTWTVNHLRYHMAQLPFWLAIGLSHPVWTYHKAMQVLTHYRVWELYVKSRSERRRIIYFSSDVAIKHSWDKWLHWISRECDTWVILRLVVSCVLYCNLLVNCALCVYLTYTVPTRSPSANSY